jgi:hypothetical protein
MTFHCRVFLIGDLSLGAEKTVMEIVCPMYMRISLREPIRFPGTPEPLVLRMAIRIPTRTIGPTWKNILRAPIHYHGTNLLHHPE